MKRQHHWSRNPNSAHQICTICGCKKDMFEYSKWKYTTADSQVSYTAPECKTLIDMSEFY